MHVELETDLYGVETFEQSRDKPWHEMAYFKELIKEGSILDLGCGNGRVYDVFMDNPKISYIGVDFSEKLIDLARERYKDIKAKNAPKFIVIWFITTALTSSLAFLAGYFFWKEHISIYNIIGIAFIMVGVALLRLKQ